MTIEQLKTEIRLAYEGHDRERMESALARLDSFSPADAPKAAPVTSTPDNPMTTWPFPHGSKS